MRKPWSVSQSVVAVTQKLREATAAITDGNYYDANVAVRNLARSLAISSFNNHAVFRTTETVSPDSLFKALFDFCFIHHTQFDLAQERLRSGEGHLVVAKEGVGEAFQFPLPLAEDPNQVIKLDAAKAVCAFISALVGLVPKDVTNFSRRNHDLFMLVNRAAIELNQFRLMSEQFLSNEIRKNTQEQYDALVQKLVSSRSMTKPVEAVQMMFDLKSNIDEWCNSLKQCQIMSNFTLSAGRKS